MLIDYEYKNKQLIVSYVDDTGDTKLKYINWTNPYNWVECSSYDSQKHPTYTTWDKFPVKKEWVNRPNKYSIGYFLQGLDQDTMDTIFKYKKPNIYFIDIETEIVDEFPDAETAKTQVLTISIVWEDKIHVLSTKALTIESLKSIQDNTNKYFEKFGVTFDIKFKLFNTEYEMLYTFVNKYVPKMPVITGWNFVKYDWQFIMNRCTNLGIGIKVTSPTGKMNLYDNGGDEDQPDLWIMPAHRVIVDYLDLYKKWDQKVKIKDSNKLDFVADKLLGLKKIHYEGNLMDLYHNEYETFIYYNVVDTVLVYFLDYVCKFIDIMLAVSELSHTRMIDSLGTVGITEGVLRQLFKVEQNIVFVDKEKTFTSKVEGGYVKDPIPGLKLLLGINDFASLYPTLWRQFNIAAESYVGLFDKNTNTAAYKNRITALDIAKEHIICSFGTVFKNEESTTKRTFTDIFYNRKKYKKMMMAEKDKKIKLEKELKELEAA